MERLRKKTTIVCVEYNTVCLAFSTTIVPNIKALFPFQKNALLKKISMEVFGNIQNDGQVPQINAWLQLTDLNGNHLQNNNPVVEPGWTVSGRLDVALFNYGNTEITFLDDFFCGGVHLRQLTKEGSAALVNNEMKVIFNFHFQEEYYDL